MAGFLDEVRRRGRAFFTNWSDSDLPLGERLAVFSRNRARAMTRGCCGNPGAPGC
jgi:hypothetical protein